MTLRERNLIKIQELIEVAQWAAVAWMDECEKEYPFKISEARRTQERQYELFCQGRTVEDIEWLFKNHWISEKERKNLLGLLELKPDLSLQRRVTDTLHSKHLLGLACDVYSAKGENTVSFYENIARLAKPYNISHPLTSAPLVDLPHFEFDRVGPRPIRQSDRTYQRALKRLRARFSGKVLHRAYNRLKRFTS